VEAGTDDQGSRGEDRARSLEAPLSAQQAASIEEPGEVDDGGFVRILPKAHVVKIGAQSLIDRGRSAVFPVVEELGVNAGRHQLIIGVGAGTRARHAYDLGSKLGLPTGLLATLGSGVSEQNSLMIAALMAKYDAVRLGKSEFSQLPMCLAAGSPVVVTGSPPYHWWEPPPSVGRLPEYRTDSGVYLIAEAFGARSMIYLKDEDGLYTDDPKKNPDATFIPRITVGELIARDFDELVVERKVLEMMSTARWAREIQIINALVPGNITRALNGEHVGTIITADE
jgi:molybdenum storage protein